MITIPESIKSLLKSDSSYKNFRVHFPNGEREDITNENIVSESVNFSEGICSNASLQFGLCENSQIQFETFGVGKIKGYKIECSIEVECPSNVEGSEYKEDIQKNIYAIPYGSFIVDSCKKQADMSHRQIIAYSENNISENAISNNEVNLAKMDAYYSTGKQDFAQNAECLFYSELPEYAFRTLPYAEMEHNTTLMTMIAGQLRTKDNVPCSIHGIGAEAGPTYIEAQSYKFLFGHKISLTDSQIIDCWNRFVQSIENADVLDAESLNKVKNVRIENNLNAFYPSYYKRYYDHRTGNFLIEHNIVIKKNIFVYYPYNANTATNDERSSDAVYMPCGFSLQIDNHHLVDPCYFLTNDDLLVEFDFTDISDVMVKSKRVKAKKQDGYNLYLPEKYPVDSVQSLVQSVCELRGLMGKPSRFGGYEFISLASNFSALYPHIELFPSASLFPRGNIGIKMDGGLYSRLWYDDDYTLPFGKIECNYNNGTEDVKGIYYLSGFDDSSPSDSYQTLVIENNALINATTISDADMNTIFEEIASNISGVVYMPLEVDMKGRPDLEAGDVVEITTTEGHITSLVLERTLTGIQMLIDSIIST